VNDELGFADKISGIINLNVRKIFTPTLLRALVRGSEVFIPTVNYRIKCCIEYL